MNPRSGGGKVGRFDLQRRAEALGAEVALLDRPDTDVQQLARDAVARGADLLGVAGGDGTQALVAQVAADADVPFLVISAGTRNHFALDLGLDREDPARGPRRAPRRRRGADRPRARSTAGRSSTTPPSARTPRSSRAPPTATTSAAPPSTTLPDLLQRPARCRTWSPTSATGRSIDGPQALLVSNDPYEATDLAGHGPPGAARPRDAGRDRRPGGHRAPGRRAAARHRHGGGSSGSPAREVVVTRRRGPRSRSASTASRCSCPPRCAAPSGPAPCGCGCPATAPASGPRGAAWSGRPCGRSRLGRPAAGPSPGTVPGPPAHGAADDPRAVTGPAHSASVLRAERRRRPPRRWGTAGAARSPGSARSARSCGAPGPSARRTPGSAPAPRARGRGRAGSPPRWCRRR